MASKFVFTAIVFIVIAAIDYCRCCNSSVTTASGAFAPQRICSGDLIFEDEFDRFDFRKWQHENTLAGGGNWEFQWYTNNRTNSFVNNSTLCIKPTLTADTYGEQFLYSGVLDVNGGAPADYCTNPSYWGCSRTGSYQNILNPIKSARIRTVESFSFCFGRVEIRARLPSGDWLWPAIWLMPRDNAYGSGWPASGEIDILESRGNLNLKQNGENIGVERVGSALHWGPGGSMNMHSLTWNVNNGSGFNNDFHIYEMIWSPDNITFKVDDAITGHVMPMEGGFWEIGKFAELGYANPWSGGTKMAPFDQEFYFIVNLAVGGVSYFPDDAVNTPAKKPWKNNSTRALTDFWKGHDGWLPTWNLDNSNDAAFKIDYIKVYAL